MDIFRHHFFCLLNIVEKSTQNGITEVHIVSAHNNKVSLEWYTDIFIQKWMSSLFDDDLSF